MAVPALLAAGGGTSYSGVIRLVQWCVIALVFLFFLRVIRAVWVEVRPAGPRQTRSERRRAARVERRAFAAMEPGRRRGKGRLSLEVIEPYDRVGQLVEIDDEVTIGRAPTCTVTTGYDIYSSTLHARVFDQDGRLWVEDLGSTNGTFVNSERIVKPMKLGRGDLVQVGATVFEVTR